MRSALIKLIVIQFVVYTVLGILGFAAWFMAFTENLSVLEVVVGEYLHEHLIRWTAQFPLWGIFILTSASLSLCAIYLLWNSRKKGVYFGIISFSIGFITNILFARNMLVHCLIGALIGWTLLAPLAAVWKDLKINNTVNN